MSGPSPEELQGFGAQCIHSAHQLAGPPVPLQAEFKEPEAPTCSGCTTDELPLVRNGCEALAGLQNILPRQRTEQLRQKWPLHSDSQDSHVQRNEEMW